MSFVHLLRPTAARLAGLAGMLALPLLASCAYDDGYYGPSYGYGYDYGPDYGYGGYGYSYGYYGNPCWPYGCGDWQHHHRRHHWDGDGDDHDHDHDNGHQHQHGGGVGTNDGPRFDPRSQNKPHYVIPPSANNDRPGRSNPVRRQPSSPYVWVPPQKDSKN